MPPRNYIPAERRLVSEWAVATYPGALKMFNVRIGAGHPTQPESGLSMEQWRGTVGLLRRFVDLIVVSRQTLVVVEAKVISKPDAIGQLLLYRDLVHATPELASYSAYRLQLTLLVAVEDPAVTSLGRTHGISCVVFKPDWVGEYLAGKAPRHQVAPQVDAAHQASPGSGSTG